MRHRRTDGQSDIASTMARRWRWIMMLRFLAGWCRDQGAAMDVNHSKRCCCCWLSLLRSILLDSRANGQTNEPTDAAAFATVHSQVLSDSYNLLKLLQIAPRASSLRRSGGVGITNIYQYSVTLTSAIAATATQHRIMTIIIITIQWLHYHLQLASPSS